MMYNNSYHEIYEMAAEMCTSFEKSIQEYEEIEKKGELSEVDEVTLDNFFVSCF